MLEGAETVGKEKITPRKWSGRGSKFLKQRELTAADTAKLAIELSNWASQGDWRLYFLYRDRIEKVTPEDVARVASTYLIRSNRTSGMFIPTEKPDRVTIPAAPPEEELFADFHPREATSAGEAFDTSPENIDARSQPISLGKGIKGVLLPKKTRGQTVHLQLEPAVWQQGEPEALSGGGRLAARPDDARHEEVDAAELQDRLDKNLATLSADGDKGVATLLDRDQAGQSARRPRSAAADPARADAAGQRVGRDATGEPGQSGRTIDRSAKPGPGPHAAHDQSLLERRRALHSHAAGGNRRGRGAESQPTSRSFTATISAQAGELALVGDFDPDEIRPLLEQDVRRLEGQATLPADREGRLRQGARRPATNPHAGQGQRHLTLPAKCLP